MKFRETIATNLPVLFKKLQKYGLIPDPYRASWRISDKNLKCDRNIIGVYRPEKTLTATSLYADRRSQYQARLNDAGNHFQADHYFGYYEARDVKIWPKFGVHLTHLGSFRDVYCGPALYNPKYEIPRLFLNVAPAIIKKEGVFLAPSWYHNFYHWMIDILPRIQIVTNDLKRGVPLIVPSHLSAAQGEALDLAIDFLGLKGIEILRLARGVYKFDRLVLPTAMSMSLDVSPRQRNFIREIISVRTPSKLSRLYISRRDASVRRISNEDDVERVLARYGFQIVTLSGLSLRTQADLFSGAEAIVGHHGAGLTNLAFCKPSTLAIEIFQDGHFSPSFARMAQLGGLNHGYLVGERQGFDTWVDTNDLEVLLKKAGLTPTA